jgi:hypothetical protein
MKEDIICESTMTLWTRDVNCGKVEGLSVK